MHAGRGKMFSGICFKKYFAFFFTEKQKKEHVSYDNNKKK